MAPPDFGRLVNPISIGGTDYAHLITTGTPGFSDLSTALIIPNVYYSERSSIITFRPISNVIVILLFMNFRAFFIKCNWHFLYIHFKKKFGSLHFDVVQHQLKTET